MLARRRKRRGALRSGGGGPVRVGGAAGRGVPSARPAGMGGSESSHGGRKVSFGLDEREQVRVLQGIRLSEDVVNRMKESPQSKRDNQRSPCSSNGTAPPSPAAEGKPKSPTGIQPPMASDSGQKSSAAEQELYRRYEREQALVQEELLRLAKREREAASEALNTALQRERNNTNEERQRAAQLPADLDAWAVELQGREAELKRQEAFYKEQLARIEKKPCCENASLHLIDGLWSFWASLWRLHKLFASYRDVSSMPCPLQRRQNNSVKSCVKEKITKSRENETVN
ncbi:MICOS complex subunit MIC25 isoform X3 [Accipiter gentilis]|uniref:MICOS complex subunit MIC25 isoform X3 n=1 Tax=Astur gentilis TaxID=8957 RepID=UPI00210FB440|nr:MICOS complex subunit MIC25 isoform X3 [Accipiter gentilis]